MGRIRALRGNYAAVTATLALVVALGMGSAYAAGKIGPNDIAASAVESRHIKNGDVRRPDLAPAAVTNAKLAPGSVTGAKIADGTVRGVDVTEASLDQVPSAARADEAANADALGGASASRYARRSIEPVRLVGTPGNPDFQNDWKNYGPGYPPAGFYKDGFGIVHLTGLLDPPNSASTVFTLPEGYRPPADHTVFGVFGDGQMTPLEVRLDGSVQVDARNMLVSLDGVTFRAGT